MIIRKCKLQTLIFLICFNSLQFGPNINLYINVAATCVPGPTGIQGRTGGLGTMGATGATGAAGATGPIGTIEISQPYREYYVSGQGSDSTGSGSSLEPFKTVQKALNTIGSATSVADFNNIATAMSTVYLLPGQYFPTGGATGSYIIPTRQVVILHLLGAQLVGNIMYQMQGAMMSGAGATGGSIYESKLILRGADVRSASPSVAKSIQSSIVTGNITLTQVGGTSSLLTQTFEILNAGIDGNINFGVTGGGSVTNNKKVLSTNGILLGILNVPQHLGTCILYIKNSDANIQQAWGGINGNVYLYSLSHVRFLGAVILQGNVTSLSASSGALVGAGTGATWHAVQFSLGPSHNFSLMSGAIYGADANSFASYLANVPHKGSEIFFMLDTLAGNHATVTTLGKLVTISGGSILPSLTNIGTMIFDTTLGIPLWKSIFNPATNSTWFNNPGPTGRTGKQGPRGVSFQVNAQGVLNNATILQIQVHAQAQPDALWYYVVTQDLRSNAEKSIPIPAGLLGDVSLHLIVCYYASAAPPTFVFTDFGEFTGHTGATGATGSTGATGTVGLRGATGGIGSTGAIGATGSSVASGVTDVLSLTSFLIISNPTTTPSITVSQPITTSSSPTFSKITASSSTFIGHATLDFPLTGGQISGDLAVGSTAAPFNYTLDILNPTLGVSFDDNQLQSWFELGSTSSITLLGAGRDFFGYFLDYQGSSVSEISVNVNLPRANVALAPGVGGSYFTDCYSFSVASTTGNIVLIPHAGDTIDWGTSTTTSSLTLDPNQIFFMCSDGVSYWIGFYNF